MKNFARGRFALSFLALIAGVTYFQPRVGETFNIAGVAEAAVVQKDENLSNIQSETTENFSEAEASVSTNLDNSTSEKEEKAEKKSVGSFKATAYCLKGRTASGGSVRRGIVAADTRILPLGTRIFVNAGAYSGTYVVADTGGAVRGKILDVWVPNCSEAIKFGRRNVSVSVLGK
jgi:3D (Asp-Asp-Asp) domain-containing protein